MRILFLTLLGIFTLVSVILGLIFIAKQNSGRTWDSLHRLFFAFLLFISATLILVIKEFIFPLLGIEKTIKYIIVPIISIATFAWLSLIKSIRYFFVLVMRLIIAIIGIWGIVCLMIFTFIALVVELTISVIRLTLYMFYFSLFGGGNRQEDKYDVKFNQLIQNSWIIRVYKVIYFSGIIFLIKMVVQALYLIINNSGTDNAKKSLENILKNLRNS